MERPRPAQIQEWIAEHDPLRVEALPDAVIDQCGHDPRSVYAETYWLSIIGPSALWALRRVTAWLEAEPAGFTVELELLAKELGLGHGTGRNSPIVRSLARLIAFDLARPSPAGMVVRRSVPPLALRHLRRLPEHLVVAHDAAAHRPAGDAA
jgi:hypothetical protein